MDILAHEPAFRLTVFGSILVTMALAELLAPRRALTAPKARRWVVNISITAINTLLARLAFPAGAVGVALYASAHGLGLFNTIALSPAWAGVASFVLLDLLIYTQHVVFHRIPLLWRLHMMHHTDLDLDVTSGARFHPIEIVLSLLIKALAVLALGAPAWSVVAFEVALNATAMFNHSNVRLPWLLDRVLRRVVVTPDMHRVHHSVLIREINSNFGFNLPWWDFIFRSYIPVPRDGHQGMKIGLANFRRFEELGLMRVLALPFSAKAEAVRIRQRGGKP
jgi:sterol desaturase/sphingolipid hydroxylase (fatty acid hydroxylase superfamily)